LVTGCHPGDCHYISGNEKAEKRVEVTKKLIEMIGLNPDRIHLEWISASEGIKFAAAVREFVDNIKRIGSNPIKKEVIEEDKEGKDIKSLIKETNAYHCIECGKCTGSCPVARINIEYSPERNVERAVFGFKNEIIADRWLWSCLTCRKCSEVCQAGVNYDEFIRGFRNIALGAGNRGNCAHGGTLLALMRLMTNSVPKRRMPWMNEVRTREKGEILYFTGCLPYFEYLFHEIGFDSPFQNIPADITSINLATVRILNEAGISPVLLPNERCCGHDLYWSGDYANFERLARLNVENIKETGAKKVIFSCAEGYRTFKMDYPEVVEDIDFEVVHISEFLADILEKGERKGNLPGSL
jgi:Fe-S oxidoreductase